MEYRFVLRISFDSDIGFSDIADLTDIVYDCGVT